MDLSQCESTESLSSVYKRLGNPESEITTADPDRALLNAQNPTQVDCAVFNSCSKIPCENATATEVVALSRSLCADCGCAGTDRGGDSDAAFDLRNARVTEGVGKRGGACSRVHPDGGGTVELLQTFGLYPKHFQPAKMYKAESGDFYISSDEKNMGEALPRKVDACINIPGEHSSKDQSQKISYDQRDAYVSSCIEETYKARTDDNRPYRVIPGVSGDLKQTSNVGEFLREGVIRARNRKSAKPKRLPGQCLKSCQTPREVREGGSSDTPVKGQYADLDSDSGRTRQGILRGSNGRTDETSGVTNRGSSELIKEAQVCETIAPKEEICDVYFPNVDVKGEEIQDVKNVLDIKSDLSVMSCGYPREGGAVTPRTKISYEDQCKIEKRVIEEQDCFKPPAQRSEGIDVNSTKPGRIMKASDSDQNPLNPHYGKSGEDKCKLEENTASSVHLDKDHVTIVECVTLSTKKEEKPDVTAIKQENVQEYELDHWCDLGPSSQQFNSDHDSFEHKDENEGPRTPTVSEARSSPPGLEEKDVGITTPYKERFLQPTQSNLFSGAYPSAFHRPASASSLQSYPARCDLPIMHSFYPTSTHSSAFYHSVDRPSQYSYPLRHSALFPDALHTHQAFNQQPFPQPRVTSSHMPFHPAEVKGVKTEAPHLPVSHLSLTTLPQLQHPSLNLQKQFHMYPGNYPPQLQGMMYPYPYFAMMPNRLNWNQFPTLAPQHYPSLSAPQQTAGHFAASLRKSSPQAIHSLKPARYEAVSPPTTTESAVSTKTDHTTASVQEAAVTVTTTNTASFSRRLPANVPLRTSGKHRMTRHNEDFIDPTRMKFGFDDEEDSDECDLMRIASDVDGGSDEEWKPDGMPGGEGAASDTDMDDEDDDVHNHDKRAGHGNGRRHSRKGLGAGRAWRKRAGAMNIKTESTGKEKKCPTCGKLCNGNYQLRRHLMSHSEHRPHRCPQCGKGFKQKAHLQGHTKSVHCKPEQPRPSRTRVSKMKKVAASTPDINTAQLGPHEVEMARKSGGGEENLMVASGEDCFADKPELLASSAKKRHPGSDPIRSRQGNAKAGRPKRALKDQEFSCHICSKTFKTAYRLKRHEQSHTDVRPYACRTCDKRFKQSGHRNEHEANHERQGIRFLCNKCGVVFRCRSSFNSHMRAHGQEQARSFNLSEDGVNKGDHDDSTKQAVKEAWEMVSTAYDCPYCVEKFATAQALNNHLETHVEIAHRRHVQPYSCDVCRRTFTYRHNLIKHSLIHKAPEKFADFYKEKMEAHVASGKPSYKCFHCSKIFIRKETLAKHMKIHSGVKPFKCPTCSQSFTQNIHLKVHMRKHTGSRPFQCRECGKGFIDSTALAKHIEYEACNSGNSVYRCKLCDKRHYYLGSIKQHMKRDHGVEADELDSHIERTERAFKVRKVDSDKAESHNKDETSILGSDRHQCLICTRAFKEKCNLLRHVRRKHVKLLKLLRGDYSGDGTVPTDQAERSSDTKKQFPGMTDCSIRSLEQMISISDADNTSDARILDADDAKHSKRTKHYTRANCDKSRMIMGCSKTPPDSSDSNKENSAQDRPNPEHNSTLNVFLAAADDPQNVEFMVPSAASVADAQTEFHQEDCSAIDAEMETKVGCAEKTKPEAEGCPSEQTENGGLENSSDSSSPSENFLYKIGLTVSTKGKNSVSSSTTPVSANALANPNLFFGDDVFLEAGRTYTEMVDDSRNTANVVLKQDGETKQISSPRSIDNDTISVLELGAKQLVCKGIFTGESFVVDLNKLDASTSCSTQSSAPQKPPRATESVVEEETDQTQSDFGSFEHCVTSDDDLAPRSEGRGVENAVSNDGFRRAPTQPLFSLYPHHLVELDDWTLNGSVQPSSVDSSCPAPLDLSHSHRRAKSSPAATSDEDISHSQTSNRHSCPSIHTKLKQAVTSEAAHLVSDDASLTAPQKWPNSKHQGSSEFSTLATVSTSNAGLRQAEGHSPSYVPLGSSGTQFFSQVVHTFSEDAPHPGHTKPMLSNEYSDETRRECDQRDNNRDLHHSPSSSSASKWITYSSAPFNILSATSSVAQSADTTSPGVEPTSPPQICSRSVTSSEPLQCTVSASGDSSLDLTVSGSRRSMAREQRSEAEVTGEPTCTTDSSNNHHLSNLRQRVPTPIAKPFTLGDVSKSSVHSSEAAEKFSEFDAYSEAKHAPSSNIDNSVGYVPSQMCTLSMPLDPGSKTVSISTDPSVSRAAYRESVPLPSSSSASRSLISVNSQQPTHSLSENLASSKCPKGRSPTDPQLKELASLLCQEHSARKDYQDYQRPIKELYSDLKHWLKEIGGLTTEVTGLGRQEMLSGESRRFLDSPQSAYSVNHDRSSVTGRIEPTSVLTRQHSRTPNVDGSDIPRAALTQKYTVQNPIQSGQALQPPQMVSLPSSGATQQVTGDMIMTNKTNTSSENQRCPRDNRCTNFPNSVNGPTYRNPAAMTSIPSASPHFPTILGLTGTSLLSDHDGISGNSSSSAKSWDSYSHHNANVLPVKDHRTSDLASANFSSELRGACVYSRAGDGGYRGMPNYRLCGNIEPGQQDFQKPKVPSGALQQMYTPSIETASVTSTTEPAAMGSPPTLPDSTVKRGNGFACGKCGKIFNARHRLKRHELTHTNFRPYR